MKIARLFNNVKKKKKVEDNKMNDVMRLMNISNPTEFPKDISTARLKELYVFVTNNKLNFEEFRDMSDKLKLIPSLMGDIGYV